MLLKELEEDPSRSHWGTHEGVDSLLGLHTLVLSRLVPMTGSIDAIYWCMSSVRLFLLLNVFVR